MDGLWRILWGHIGKLGSCDGMNWSFVLKGGRFTDSSLGCTNRCDQGDGWAGVLSS